MYKYKFTNIVWDKPLSFLYNKIDNYVNSTVNINTLRLKSGVRLVICVTHNSLNHRNLLII